jgi:integrase
MIVAMPREQFGTVLPTGQKVKSWTGFWYVTVDAKRLQRSKVLGRKADMTKGQARAALRAIITTPAVAVVKAAPLTFEEGANRYLGLKQGDWAKKTRETMASLFKTLILPRIGHRLMSEIVPSDCKALFNSIAELGKSKSAVEKCVTHVRAVFEVQVEDGHLLRNPAKSKSVGVPKVKRKVDDRFLTLAQCHKLLVTAEGYDLMLLQIMLGTALRPSEAFALRVEDIEPGRLRIDEAAVCNQPLGPTKNEVSDGHVPISTELEADLREYAKDMHDPKAFLFPGETGRPMIHENYLERRLKPLGMKAGVGDINFRMLRRTVATNLQDHGPVTSAQGLLRHGNSSTTLKNYVKPIPDGVRKTADSWDAALRKTKKKVSLLPQRARSAHLFF